MDILRKTKWVYPQQRCFVRVCTVHKNIVSIAKNALILTLGRLDNHKMYLGCIISQVRQKPIKTVALSGSGSSRHKSMHGQAVTGEQYFTLFFASQVIDMSHGNFDPIIPAWIHTMYIPAERYGFPHRNAVYLFLRQRHMYGKF